MKSLYKYHSRCLVAAGIPEVNSSLEILFCRTLSMPFEHWARPRQWPVCLPVSAALRLHRRLKLRRSLVPIQYLLGVWPFGELQLHVRPPVFIPRPETPQLVDLVQAELGKRRIGSHTRSGSQVFFEVGVGAGGISALLLKRESNLTGIGCDVNPLACRLTHRNLMRTIGRTGLETRYTLLNADFARLTESIPSLDFIVSNPPYIGETEYATLSRQVKSFESRRALVSPEEGFWHAREILLRGRQWLKPHGFVALELDELQIDRLRACHAELGYSIISVERDYFGRVRFVLLQLL